MKSRLIRSNPRFEMYIENEKLFINDEINSNNNIKIRIAEISKIELLYNDNFFEKVFTFLLSGWELPKNSTILKIYSENENKEIVLTNCNIKNVENIYFEINNRILQSKKIKNE